MQQRQQYKYFAFISYNSKDTKWGKKIQRKLEGYRMPATLCSEHGWERNPIKPVFFAPTDIQPGGLTAELQERLRASRNLIVICSPNSAKSQWVGKEIEYFHSLGRTDYIHFFIVEGTPHSGNEDTECFNPVVETLGLPEILGANIHEKVSRWPWVNKERAYVQLITKLLGVEFDRIWQRHKRMMIEKVISLTIAVISIAFAIAFAIHISLPVDVEMTLKEITPHNSTLPQLKNAKVSLRLPNEKKDTTFFNIDEEITFTNIPADMIGKEVRVIFSCDNYTSIDTTFVLSREISLNVSRDINVYGHVRFTLCNQLGKPLANKSLNIDKINVRSDSQGIVDVMIPYEKQRQEYDISSPIITLKNTKKTMPSGDSDVIIAEH